ncbi:MAG TPA: hypothetical protein VEF89_10350 [Solirubrobacteraceae bacterium]|nr:hypothetical protein [Solirubrobacteraceae bacterium]
MQQMTLGRYVTRAGRKPGVREHTQSAVASSKSAYRRLNKAKSPAEALNDKKLRRDLRRVSSSAGAALIALGTPPRMRTRDALALGVTLSTLLIAAGVLFARSDRLRAKGQGKQSEPVEEPDGEQPRASTAAPAPLAPAEPPDDPLG